MLGIVAGAVRALHAGRLRASPAAKFLGSETLFALVLLQLMIMPDVLIVENYRTLAEPRPGRYADRASRCPISASAFGIFLLRQTFRTIPQELDDAARLEG